jgi:hypothetical protein
MPFAARSAFAYGDKKKNFLYPLSPLWLAFFFSPQRHREHKDFREHQPN